MFEDFLLLSTASLDSSVSFFQIDLVFLFVLELFLDDEVTTARDVTRTVGSKATIDVSPKLCDALNAIVSDIKPLFSAVHFYHCTMYEFLSSDVI